MGFCSLLFPLSHVLLILSLFPMPHLLVPQLHLANHNLFSERITNLQHSVNAVLEIPISFVLTGEHAVSKAQLESFWTIMKHYLLVEEKDKWIDVFIAGHTIDAVNNALGYSLWVTHRASFAQVNSSPVLSIFYLVIGCPMIR
jgi:hypothetical protein